MRFLLTALLLAWTVTAASAGQRKPPVISVRLHPEGSEREGPSFVAPIDLASPAKRVFIKKVAVMSERDIEAIYPFSSADGSLGCTFLLDASGRQRIEEHTTNARDAIVVALINGRVASALRIDRRITDGIVTIPSGFLPEEILALQALHPTLGKEKQFASQQREAEAALRKAASARAKSEKSAAKEKQTPQ